MYKHKITPRQGTARCFPQLFNILYLHPKVVTFPCCLVFPSSRYSRSPLSVVSPIYLLKSRREGFSQTVNWLTLHLLHGPAAYVVTGVRSLSVKYSLEINVHLPMSNDSTSVELAFLRSLKFRLTKFTPAYYTYSNAVLAAVQNRGHYEPSLR